MYAKLANLAVFLSEPTTLIEREPEYLFNAIWQFAQVPPRIAVSRPSDLMSCLVELV